MSVSKIVAAAASSAGNDPLDVDEVFSIDLWDGTGRYSGSRAEQTITNGIDFSTNGGMVYIKGRGTGTGNGNRGLITSTPELGLGNFLYTAHDYAKNSNQTSNTYAHTGPNQYNTDGFKLGDERDGWSAANDISTPDYVGYSFRKAKKFFTCLTYSGTGSAQNISHDLGSTPGMIWIKKTSATSEWFVWHTGVGNTGYLILNGTDAKANYSNWLNPTSTTISLQNDSTNNSGATYVAYLFAHNNNDGEFGPDSDQDIIKCGSFTKGDSGFNNFVNVNLGFEVQFLLTKVTNESSGNWELWDIMRGMSLTGNKLLYSNLSGAESNYNDPLVYPTANGFAYRDNNANSYIYMAIRRGPLAAPDDATKVFGMQDYTGTSGSGSGPNGPITGFVTDFALFKNRPESVTESFITQTRLTGQEYLLPSNENAGATLSNGAFDRMDGAGDTGLSGYNIWGWKRAFSYFEVVHFFGNGSTSQNISHNLGVAPEMMWVKCRTHAESWIVYHSGTGNGKYLVLNTAAGAGNWTGAWNATSPTGSVFTVGNGNAVNLSSRTYIAYLFATAEGVSKVGSYTGNGSAQNIECGFSSGARFVLIKKTTGISDMDWWLFDTVRGLVSGDDQRLFLNTTAPQYAADYVDPYSAGFSVGSFLSENGVTYIFYAIA